MRLTKTHQRILDALQVGRTRQDLAANIGSHPGYCAKALRQLVDAGLVEAVKPTQEWTYRAKAKLALVPIETASLTDGAQDAG